MVTVSISVRKSGLMERTVVGSEYRKIEGILRECEGVQEGVRLGGISIKVEREGGKGRDESRME